MSGKSAEEKGPTFLAQALRQRGIAVDLSSEGHLCVSVRLKPGARKETCGVNAEGNLLISLRARPVEGEANDALCAFLAEQLGLAKGRVQLVKGEKSRSKRLALDYSFSKAKDEKYFLDKWEKWIEQMSTHES